MRRYGPSKGSVDAALVQAAHERCLEVHPYTVNEVSEWTLGTQPNAECRVVGTGTHDATPSPEPLDVARGCRAAIRFTDGLSR
jgi:hypothetical protein